MKCPRCGMRATRGRIGNKTQENTTEIEYVEQWCCTNKNCDLYAGPDLNNPLHVAKRKSEIKQSVDF